MRITLIAAMDRRRTLGHDGKLPWHLPDDLAHFKARTLGKTLIMGRKTFATLKAPLPKRRTIVLTRNPDFHSSGVEVVHTVEAALALAGPVDELMVVGGGEIYSLFLDRADLLDLTWIDAEFPGDAYFPAWNPAHFALRSRRDHPRDERHAYPFSFLEYVRVN
jgi:dihydrofolate reductase